MLNEDIYKTAFESSNVAVCITGITGYLHVNNAFCELTGYTVKELEQLTWQDITPADEAESLKLLIQQVFNGQSEGFKASICLISKNGSPVYANIYTAVCLEKDGSLQCLITTVIDVTGKKKLEDELSYYQELLEETGRIAKVGGWEFDAITGKGTWTDEVARIHDVEPGFETNVQIGLSYYQDADKRKIEEAVNEAVVGGKPYDLELQINTAKGNKKWIRTIGHPVIENNRVTKVRGSFQDITEQKETERKLRESEQRFFTIFHSSPIGTNLFSVKTGKSLDVNDAYLRITGYSRDEMIGHTAYELNLFVDQEARDIWMKELREKGGVYDVEAKFRCKSNETKDVLASIEIVEIDGEKMGLVVAHDITERKNTEAALKESEEKFAQAFQLGPAGLVIARFSDGLIINANQPFFQLTEYRRSDVIGHLSTDIGILSHQTRSLFVQKMRKDGALHNYEMAITTKSGKQKDILVSAKPMLFDGTQCNIIAMTDITDRKLALRLLSESEERYRTILNDSPVAVAVHVDGKVAFANPAGMKMFGLTAQDSLIGKPVMEMIHPDWRKETMERADKLARGELVDYPVRSVYLRADGTPVDVEIMVSPLMYNGKKAIQAIVTDVTERIRAEKKLKESEEKYRSVFENSSVAILLSSPDGTIHSANEAACRLYGMTEEEICLAGRHGLTDTTDTRMQRLLEERKQLGHATREVTLIKKDGSRFPAEVSSVLFSDSEGRELTSIIIRDLTEQKKAEELLRTSEERLRLSTELADVAVWEYDVLSNKLSRSRNHDKLYGVEWSDKWKFSTIITIAHPDDKKTTETRLKAALLPSSEDQFVFDFRVVHSDQSVHWLNVIGQVVKRDSEGNALILRGCLIDITARKEAELEIVKLNDELEDRVAERTARLRDANKDLESFSYSISHDLRAPLRAIYGFSQILSERHRQALNDEGRQYMDYIVSSSIRMEQLINDLLDYSRLSRKPLIMNPVSLRKIIENVYSDYQMHIEAAGGKLEMMNDLPGIEGDETLLRQIFSNLIGNAIKYRHPDIPLLIKISAEPHLNGCIIRVADNGIGIAPEYHEKIFNVFQRLHSESKYPGTGIGLATVKKAVRMLNGSVTVESEIGKGSIFILDFPENSCYE